MSRAVHFARGARLNHVRPPIDKGTQRRYAYITMSNFMGQQMSGAHMMRALHILIHTISRAMDIGVISAVYVLSVVFRKRASLNILFMELRLEKHIFVIKNKMLFSILHTMYDAVFTRITMNICQYKDVYFRIEKGHIPYSIMTAGIRTATYTSLRTVWKTMPHTQDDPFIYYLGYDYFCVREPGESIAIATMAHDKYPQYYDWDEMIRHARYLASLHDEAGNAGTARKYNRGDADSYA